MAPAYSSSQRSAIAQFVSFTQSKESVAGRFLKNHAWNVEQAIDAFYQSGTGSTNPISSLQNNLSKVFDQYRDQPKEQQDHIGISGVGKYLADLNVDFDELTHLALCELLQCSTIGEFEREKFIAGWRSATSNSNNSQPCDSIDRQASYAASMRKRLSAEPALFKQVYRYTFTIARPEGQKSMPMDVALEFWRMFFLPDKGGMQWNSPTTPWLDLWLDFYKERSKRPVNKDLWNMVGELVVKTKEPGGESLEWWEEDGAWPMAVDEFVESVKEKRKDASMDIS